MKKLLFLFAAMLAMGVVNGQRTGISSIDINQEPSPGEKTISANPHARVKAERDFLSSRKKAENIRWYEISDGFFVYYSEKGIKGKSHYNKKGKFIYNILFRDERSLPYEIRNRVKSVYYFDYKITNALEIHTQGKTIYLVRFTDYKIWKTVRICDDEMEVIEEFKATTS